MPNQPATPNRTLRIPDGLWQRARRIAKVRGETITAVVIRALERYVRTYGDDE